MREKNHDRFHALSHFCHEKRGLTRRYSSLERPLTVSDINEAYLKNKLNIEFLYKAYRIRVGWERKRKRPDAVDTQLGEKYRVRRDLTKILQPHEGQGDKEGLLID